MIAARALENVPRVCEILRRLTFGASGSRRPRATRNGDEDYKYPNIVAHRSCSVDRLRGIHTADLDPSCVRFQSPPLQARCFT